MFSVLSKSRHPTAIVSNFRGFDWAGEQERATLYEFARPPVPRLSPRRPAPSVESYQYENTVPTMVIARL